MSTTIETLNQWAQLAFSFAWPMLLQSSLLIGVLFALDRLLGRRVRAAVMYALWLSVLVKLLLPPSLALPSGISYWLRSPAQAPVLQTGPAVVITYGSDNLPGLHPLSLPAPPRGRRVSVSIAAWGLAVSSCASFGLLGWMLVRWRQVKRDMRQATAAPRRLDELLEEARHSAGVRFSVRVRIIDRAMSPSVFGILHPLILLPRTLVEQLTSTQMRAVLVHELIHLRRGDVWLNCLQALLQIVYWWHPLVWLANARIRHVREEAVDDAVMQNLRNDGGAYATTLLEVAKLVLHRPLTSLGLVGILESNSSLRRRIERLIDFHPPQKAGLTLASGLCILAFGALALPMGQAPPNLTSAPSTPVNDSPVRPIDAQVNQATKPVEPVVQSPRAASEDIKTRNDRDAAALVQEARALFDVGKIQAAKKNLGEVLEYDSENQEMGYYLKLIELKNALERHELAFQETAESHPPSIQSNEARMALINKLSTMRLASVQFDSLTLDAVIRFLNDQTRKLDPTKQGIKFVISSAPSKRGSGSEQSDLGDIAAVQIRILPALSDVRVVDVLDAIVKVADKPIRYYFQGQEVVFDWKPKVTPPLYTRLIKVDPSNFEQGLERAAGFKPSAPSVNGPEVQQELLRKFFQTQGADLYPPKTVFFNDREGTLLVHATLADLDLIEQVVYVLNTPPPQVNIKVRFFEVPEELAGPVWRLLNSTNQATGEESGLKVVLTSPQLTVFRKSMESSSQVKLMNEAAVTTLSGRQFEVQVVDLKTIATNVNPRALEPPGVSAGTEGVYQEGHIPFGPTLEAVATIQSFGDKWQIQLNTTARMTELSHYDRTNQVRVYVDGKRKTVPFALPHFITRKMTASAEVSAGQALVIGTQMDELPRGTRKPAKSAKRLLAIITPTVIDSAGNPVSEADRPPHF